MTQNRVIQFSHAFIALTFICLVLGAATPAHSQDKQEAPRTPVLLELFTAEGCSSCPPADDLVARLKKEQPIPGVLIVPIGLHVNYWNRQGWTDRFSSPDYTERQEDYRRRFKLDDVYTPQIIVDGRAAFAANDVNQIYSRIADAARIAKPITINVDHAGDRLKISAESAAPVNADLMLAVVEDNLQTEVKAGENGGRVLKHSAVLRNLKKLTSMKTTSWSKEIGTPSGRDWKTADQQFVVFAQDRSNGAIVGLAVLPVNASPQK
jgi:hypothetical protein